MAASKYYFKPLAQRLLSTAIATLPAMAIADNPLHPHQQWVCQPGSQGDWQCQHKNATPGAYPQPARPPQKQPLAQQISAAVATNEWDWIPKAQLTDQSLCKTGCNGAYIAPEANWEDAEKKPDNAPLRADAEKSNMAGDIVTLEGDIALTKGNRLLKADIASLNRANNELIITGNVEAREPNLLVRAESATVNTETNLGYFEDASFLQHESGTRGTARLLHRGSNSTLSLEQASITQCTPDDEVWLIKASSIHLDTEEGWGSAKHARLKIKDVPVFYAPYMTFPIDDRRKSGFLWPTFGSSNDNGFELSAPYYLNLAPNYDATIAPRYIEKRGIMTELELRQLSSFGSWVLAGAQLTDDLYTDIPPAVPLEPGEDDGIPPQENRWTGNVTHSGNIFGISTSIDYSKVSDEDFFSDLATDNLDLKRTDHLNQQVTLGYRSTDWQLELTAQDHQTIDDELSKQYQLMPRLTVEHNESGANFGPEWLAEAEFTDFQHEQSINDGGTFKTGERAFAEAGVSYPMRWASGFIIPTAKVRSVNYQLDDVAPGDDDSPSATTPLATLDMGLIFERSANFSGSSYLQTLEPRLYYFYSDYEEQDHGLDFDTRELNFGYSQLFRDTRFSGHDRLDDANQASVGITSRFIESTNGRELVTLSLGQTFYFEDRRVHLGNTPERLSNSNIAGEIQYQPSDQLWLTNTLLWDSRRDKLEEGGLSFHYQSDGNSLYNLGYRFRREGNSDIGEGLRDISQVDASAVVPITDRWSLFSRFRYDTEGHRSLDDLVGLQYEDCCWMVRLLYQQGLEDERVVALDPPTVEPNTHVIVERDYAFILEFQLKGLGSLGNKAESLLEKSILGYEDLD